MAEIYFPPVSFLFSVEMLDNTTGGSRLEAGFQEVSGISVEMQTDKIPEGGQNLYAHKVPSRISNDSNLVLKRGLVTGSSVFGKWCRDHFSQGLNTVTNSKKIAPKNIIVHLLDIATQKPIMAWAFANAYPVKWEISGLNAKESNFVVESLTLAYSYFAVIQPKS